MSKKIEINLPPCVPMSEYARRMFPKHTAARSHLHHKLKGGGRAKFTETDWRNLSEANKAIIDELIMFQNWIEDTLFDE